MLQVILISIPIYFLLNLLLGFFVYRPWYFAEEKELLSNSELTSMSLFPAFGFGNFKYHNQISQFDGGKKSLGWFRWRYMMGFNTAYIALILLYFVGMSIYYFTNSPETTNSSFGEGMSIVEFLLLVSPKLLLYLNSPLIFLFILVMVILLSLIYILPPYILFNRNAKKVEFENLGKYIDKDKSIYHPDDEISRYLEDLNDN